VLFFISLESRRIEFVACTANPTGAWVAQQARNLLMAIDDREQPFRFLIHDRDSKFSGDFDHVFHSEEIAVIRTPVQAPNANAHAERWVLTIRNDCLDRLPHLQPPPARTRAPRLHPPLQPASAASGSCTSST
jgi:putative transposase